MFEGLGKLIGVFGSLIILMVVRGFVIMKAWGWFLVPFGLPVIGIAWAIGIAFVGNMITGTKQHSPIEETDNPIATFIIRMVSETLGYLVALFFVWLIYLCM